MGKTYSYSQCFPAEALPRHSRKLVNQQLEVGSFQHLCQSSLRDCLQHDGEVGVPDLQDNCKSVRSV